MTRISQLKLPLGHDRKDMIEKMSRILGVKAEGIDTFNIIKQSIGTRKEPDILYGYVADAKVRQIPGEKEEKLVQRLRDGDVLVQETICYHLPGHGTAELEHPPVTMGTRSASLLCGLILAGQGYCPVLLEREEDMDTRTKWVAGFWEGGELHPDSSMQLGEGGAGVFSDRKLNTLIKDSFKHNRAVLQTLVELGADLSILHMNRPHIGTDVLSRIVKVMRRETQQLGGQVRSLGKATGFMIGGGRLKAVVVSGVERTHTRVLVTAIGYSARDILEAPWDRGIPMETKAFAVGLRVQHPQTLINMSQHAAKECRELGPASYRVTRRIPGGRGVYSLCMRPSGYAANASSEQGCLVVNEMSYHDRAGGNASSALVMTVTSEDFPHTGCLALGGIKFQRSLGGAAFRLGEGSIPVQFYGDFKEDRVSAAFGQVMPAFKGEYAFANLGEMLPSYISRSPLEVMEAFGYMIKGFDRPDAILAGIESRTSSPVRVPRDENLENTVKGTFSCGKGAGYAGGITSAAMGGTRTAEEIIHRYRPFET